MDLDNMNEWEVMDYYNKGKITKSQLDAYFNTTPIYDRILRNNSVWDAIKQ